MSFDEKCPHCSTDIECHALWNDRDYMANFTFPCPKCGKGIECIVHSVPEFELVKQETPAAYAEKLAKLKDRLRQIELEKTASETRP